MSDRDPAYIARDLCGCIVGATVDDPDHASDTAKIVAEWVRDGLTLERTTVGEAREDPTFLRCSHGPVTT